MGKVQKPGNKDEGCDNFQPGQVYHTSQGRVITWLEEMRNDDKVENPKKLWENRCF
jgi:hypothetical protein